MLTVISAGSVYLVNKSREDNAWVIHTVEAESQISNLLLEIRRVESATALTACSSPDRCGPQFFAG